MVVIEVVIYDNKTGDVIFQSREYNIVDAMNISRTRAYYYARIQQKVTVKVYANGEKIAEIRSLRGLL